LKIILLLLSLTFSLAHGLSPDCYNCARNLSFASPVVPEWPIEYVSIKKINYERNAFASFCKRPVEMIDTIVLHHSETPSTDTPEDINDLHLGRTSQTSTGRPQEPWYMIGYSYVVNSPYPGNTRPEAQVAEGRPLDIVGAHAGSQLYVPMNELQKKLWNEKKVVCGIEGGDFTVDPTKVRDGKISPNITTIGLVVIGNYAPFSRTNPNGYRKSNPRYPTKATQDLVARTACQLQKKYPLIKNIKWHNYYHNTSCPGTLKNYIGQIKTLARKYGCEFN
jgi:hypothetical protein